MDHDPSDDRTRAALALRDASRVVVFTGAGVSAESGVPTFRDALTGLWARFDPQSLDTPEAYQENPALVWGWYEWRRSLVRSALPNPGHLAIAAMERQVPTFTLVTQNIDDLHERAGSTAPVHLHGSLFAPRCVDCQRPIAVADPVPGASGPVEPPTCAHCAGRARPGVVWFGEAMPVEPLDIAMRSAAECDVLVSVGTSGLVFPAADVPFVAAANAATVIQVNPDPTPLDDVARFNLRGPAGELLPALVAIAWPNGPTDRHGGPTD